MGSNPDQTRLRTPLQDNLRLAWDLARRDLEAKYRRSLIGLLWLVLTPLSLLGIYSLVFGLIFGVQWRMPHEPNGATVGFVLPFFAGLAIYLALSDVVNSSVNLFVSKRTYVVKSPFPLWVLWLANLLRASAHACVTLGLVVALALVQHRLTFAGAWWMVLSLLLCVLFLCAASLLLASIGPFIGDMSEVMRLLLRVMFYATPITYPLALLPSPFHDLAWLNPLTCMVEFLRDAIVFGRMPPAAPMLGFLIFSAVLLAVGIWVFRRVQGVISDVV